MAALYIWQNDDWPKMHWDENRLSGALAEVNLLRGKLLGALSMFGLEERNSSMIESMAMELVHSSEIEGERLSADSVRSSIAHHLGLKYAVLPPADHYIEGVVKVMLDATQNYRSPIDSERLFGWHAALFPTGRSAMHRITVGAWREGDEPMQVVSGAIGHEKVHYVAPQSCDVPAMMNDFLAWIDDDTANIDPVVRAAVAHLWFVIIHPFDDGNGRVCRTITEMLLSRADDTSQRYYSLSSAILKNRSQYYSHLEAAQKGDLDVTEWIEWFLMTLKSALVAALEKTDRVVRKTRFWDENRDVQLNERQRKVLNVLLDGFEGKLNSSKWYKLCHCSQDTALRDINDLIAKGILRKKQEGGRSTNYEIVF